MAGHFLYLLGWSKPQSGYMTYVVQGNLPINRQPDGKGFTGKKIYCLGAYFIELNSLINHLNYQLNFQFLFQTLS